MNTTTRLGLLGILHFTFCIFNCSAELTATVYPGYTLSANERPTTAILNLLARPSVTVSGTLGGTNVGLAANSVSGAMLMTSVVDDDTIEFFNNGGSTAIRLKAYNTGTNAIDANLAGLGLGGGDGFALSNKTDNVSLTITNDVLTLMTNLSATYLNVASNGVVVGTSTNRGQTVDIGVFARILATNQYASSEISLNAGVATVLLNAAHGLAMTPTQVRGVIVCQTSDAGYAVGDEVDMIACGGVENGESFERGDVFAFGANATNVFCVQSVYYMYVANKSTTNPTQLVHSRWKAKIYARP
jgi:hypothetical protein